MGTHITIIIPMPDSQALLALLRLVSPALPVGAYSYSQGFESAVEQQWVHDEDSAYDWLHGVMSHGLCQLELPLLRELYQALEQQDFNRLQHWNEQSHAFRESKELRLEETQMGKALWRLLNDLDIPLPELQQPAWISAYAIAAHHWHITLQDAAYGFVWSWLENQLAAASKIIPLGQTQIQRLTSRLLPSIDQVVSDGLAVSADEMGMGLPGLVIGSMLHETQYSRLFRS